MGSTSSHRRHHISRPLPHPRLSGSTLPPRGTVYVVERLGRFSRVLNSSSPSSPLLPLVDKVIAAFSTRRVEQSTPSEGLPTLCWGRSTVTVHAHWTVRVLDPKRLAYRIDKVDRTVESLVHVRIRDAFAALSPNALPSLANPRLLTTMSEGIRQGIDETARTFGVACSSFQISSIDPSPQTPTRPRFLYYPQPVEPLPPNLNLLALPPPPTRAPLPPPPPPNQRSLNLAAEPVAAPPHAPVHNDFETVLPELPGNAYPMNRSLPPMIADEDDDDSDDDRTSLEDSSIENRPPPDGDPPAIPTQTVPTKQTIPKSPTPTKEVLYAPPPSPTPSQDGVPQQHMQSPETLPEVISRVLNAKQPTEEGALPTTDSSYEELPPAPVLTAPAHPISPPMPAPTEEDFTPSLAKYLDGLPPTPTIDLPSSETSDEAVEGDTHDEATREDGGDTRADGDTGEENVEVPSSPRTVEKMDETGDLQGSPMLTESVPLSMVSSEVEKGVPRGVEEGVEGIALEHNPFEIVDEPMNTLGDGGLPSPPPEQVSREDEAGAPSSEAAIDKESDTEATAEVGDLANQLDSREQKNMEQRNTEMKEPARQSEQVGESVEATDVCEASVAKDILDDQPVGSSVQREPRRRRQQTPTASIFEGESGSMEQLPRRLSSNSVGDSERLPDAPQQVERAPVTKPRENAVDAVPANGRRVMPLRAAKVAVQRGNFYEGATRMDVERKRNMAMSEYQPAGKRQAATSVRTYDKVAGPVSSESVRGLSNAAESSVPDRRVQRSRSRDVAAMESDSNLFAGRRGRTDSEWLSPRDDEALARKEQARRERMRKELDVIEQSQAKMLGTAGISSDEEFGRRRDVSEEGSDSEHDIFHDAYGEEPIAAPATEELGHSSSKRRPKSRHRHRRNSRREEGFYAEESSSSEDMCEACAHHRHFDYHDHERVPRTRSRSRSKSETSRRRVQDDDADLHSESFSEARSTTSSRSRSRSDRKSTDSRRSDHSSRERSHKSKKSSSKDRKLDRVEKSERSSSEKRSKESSKSRSKSSDRKRSHERSSRSSSKKSSSREVEPEKRRREGKSKSKSKHGKPKSPGPSDYTHNHKAGGPKPIYRHRAPDSDSGIENPIPWYCEGQSAPEDTDVDVPRGHSESETRGGRSTHTTVYSSYGRRDKRGRRRRAHHNRRVTFLYDDL